MKALRQFLIVGSLIFPGAQAATAQNAMGTPGTGAALPAHWDRDGAVVGGRLRVWPGDGSPGALGMLQLNGKPSESFPVAPDMAPEARSPWRYPLIGAAAGAVAGAVLAMGLDSLGETEDFGDLVGPEVYLVYIPAGAVLGGVVGFVVDRLTSD